MKFSFEKRGRIGGAVAVAALIAGLAPTSASATGTRAWNLGVMNRYILDDANRWLYPHAITKYGSLFYIELYGLGDSIAATAPTSMRSRDATGNMLAAADIVPVQGTAGGGAIISLTDDLFISFHLSDYENPAIRAFLAQMVAAGNIVAGDPNSFGWVSSGRMPNPITEANRKWDIFIAYNLADMVNLGLQFSIGSSNYGYTPNASDANILQGNRDELRRDIDSLGSSEFRFLLSGGIELNDALAIDAAFGMAFHGITYLPNNRVDLLDGGGGLEIQADVRAMIGITEWWELIPAISIRTVGLSATDRANFGSGLDFDISDNSEAGRETTNITDIKTSSFILDMGVAGHFKPNDIVQFWGAMGFQLQKRAFQYEHFIADNPGSFPRNDPANTLEYLRDSQSYTALPYLRLALEARVFSWLDFRGGVVKYMRGDSVRHEQINDQDTNENQDNDFQDDMPFFDYFVGIGAHYEGFFLDMQLDPLWFKRGPDFLSGSGANMFVNGSLGYRY